MRFDIPEKCYIRWQAALAVLEDLQEDTKAPLDMTSWMDRSPAWDGTTWECGGSACYAGWMAIAPYCLELGLREFGEIPKDRAKNAASWLLGLPRNEARSLERHLFMGDLDQPTREKTLTLLKRRLKDTFKKSTGKNLVAPLTFWIEP